MLDSYGEAWRLSAADLRPLADGLQGSGWRRVGDLLATIPPPARARTTYGLIWLCKMGVLDWR